MNQKEGAAHELKPTQATQVTMQVQSVCANIDFEAG
jgi:hypothetical protein